MNNRYEDKNQCVVKKSSWTNGLGSSRHVVIVKQKRSVVIRNIRSKRIITYTHTHTHFGTKNIVFYLGCIFSVLSNLSLNKWIKSEFWVLLFRLINLDICR